MAVRLFMGAVYSVCASAAMTLAGDVLPPLAVTKGISRFALTVSIGMAFGPFVGIQIQNRMSSRAAFLTVFAMTVAALILLAFVRIAYPKKKRRPFSLRQTLHRPSFPFTFNMTFFMIPYGAVIAYSAILAQEKNLSGVLPYFYICLVAGMLSSKLSTQKAIDAGHHRIPVYVSILVLTATMLTFPVLESGRHLLIAGYLFGLGYGILQPLFQSFVTGTTEPPFRGAANATYMLSYDIGIGLGALLTSFLSEQIGIARSFAVTAAAFPVGPSFTPFTATAITASEKTFTTKPKKRPRLPPAGGEGEKKI